MKGRQVVFGFEDPFIWMAWLFVLSSTALCVVYGALNWNRDGDDVPTPESITWAQDEDRIDEEL